MLIGWTGYLLMVRGWTLIKGINVTTARLASPYTTFEWAPRGQAEPLIPATQIFPGKSSSSASPAAAPSSSSGLSKSKASAAYARAGNARSAH